MVKNKSLSCLLASMLLVTLCLVACAGTETTDVIPPTETAAKAETQTNEGEIKSGANAVTADEATAIPTTTDSKTTDKSKDAEKSGTLGEVKAISKSEAIASSGGRRGKTTNKKGDKGTWCLQSDNGHVIYYTTNVDQVLGLANDQLIYSDNEIKFDRYAIKDAKDEDEHEDGQETEEEKVYFNEYGNLVDEYGRPVDEEGRLVDEYGRFIDEYDRLVDKYGRLVDENGHLIDEEGNPIEEDDLKEFAILIIMDKDGSYAYYIGKRIEEEEEDEYAEDDKNDKASITVIDAETKLKLELDISNIIENVSMDVDAGNFGKGVMRRAENEEMANTLIEAKTFEKKSKEKAEKAESSASTSDNGTEDKGPTA